MRYDHRDLHPESELRPLLTAILKRREFRISHNGLHLYNLECSKCAVEVDSPHEVIRMRDAKSAVDLFLRMRSRCNKTGEILEGDGQLHISGGESCEDGDATPPPTDPSAVRSPGSKRRKKSRE